MVMTQLPGSQILPSLDLWRARRRARVLSLSIELAAIRQPPGSHRTESGFALPSHPICQANFRANCSSAFLIVYDSRFTFRRIITGVSFSVWRLPLTSTPAWRLNRK